MEADIDDPRANVAAALDAFRQGRMVVIEDTKRPGRGAIVVVAAERTSTDSIGFMAVNARGLISLALPPERLEQLGLTLQGDGDSLDRENYTVSVEARVGVTTGISAPDRARTVQVLADRRTRPDDLVTPGHLFPAQAAPRGVVERPGWAEAALDLARIAGMSAATTFCQVLDADGEVATGQAIIDFTETHGLRRISIAGLLAHRMATESFVTLINQATLPTHYGDFIVRVFRNDLDGKEHLAVTRGEMHTSEPMLVRLHSECVTGDIFASRRCDCGAQLNAAMRMIADEGRGIVLYLRQEGRGIGIVNKTRAYALQDAGRDTVEANLELGLPADLRDYGVGAQMLLALGVQRIRLLTNNPRKVADLAAHGIEIVAREALEIEPTPENQAYLSTKKAKLGHLLSKV